MVGRCRFDSMHRAVGDLGQNGRKGSNYDFLVKPALISACEDQISTKRFGRRKSWIGQRAKDAAHQSFQIGADGAPHTQDVFV